VLVEIGFLTNGSEAKRLVTKSYRESVAAGISRGIKSYIKGIEMVYQGN
jgi:N-acetylmuramoyl-L-alanine amidase